MNVSADDAELVLAVFKQKDSRKPLVVQAKEKPGWASRGWSRSGYRGWSDRRNSGWWSRWKTIVKKRSSFSK